jgi:hypothetical protein
LRRRGGSVSPKTCRLIFTFSYLRRRRLKPRWLLGRSPATAPFSNINQKVIQTMPIRKRLIGENGLMASFVALPNVANTGGTGGSNVTVSLATSFQDGYGVGTLPNDYVVVVSPSAPAIPSVTGKTTSGFSVVLSPITASATVAAGTFDVVVLGNS